MNYKDVQAVTLTDRGSGSETIQVQTAHVAGLTSPTSITLNVHVDDAVNIRATASAVTVNGTGSASSTEEGVTIGSGAPSLGGTLANILAPITVNNVSTVAVDDSGDTANRTGTVSAKSITGFGLPSSSLINYSSVGQLTVRGGSGSNTDTVTGTSAKTTLYPGTSKACNVNVKATAAALTINGSNKVDYVTVGSRAPSLGGTLAGVTAPITVTNTSADSTLTLDDSGDTASRNGILSPTQVTGLGMGLDGSVTYAGKQLASLTLRGNGNATLLNYGESTDTNLIGVRLAP